MRNMLNMKKLLSLTALCCCTALFTACGSNGSSSGSITAADAPSQQEQTAERRADVSSSPESSLPETSAAPTDTSSKTETEDTMLKISVNGTELTAELADNSSAKALTELLDQGKITIDMSDYGGFEKVGDLPQNLPTNDENITTVPGDIILYQGNKITIYYAENTWDFTKLGHIGNITQDELKAILGGGDVTVTLSI